MREVLTREYEILISAPSDVYSFVETVKAAIAEYNNEQGVNDNIRFVQKNWREHSFPAYGKSAQDIINEQLTNRAEIVIALFGAKFGEPTENYLSGTLEEIETVHRNGGRVMTYFYKGASDIGSIDADQLKKVQDFQKNYKGLYAEFKDADELKQKVYINLIKLSGVLAQEAQKDLRLYSFKEDELHEELTYSQYDFLHSGVTANLEQRIRGLIEQINAINLPKPKPKVVEKSVEKKDSPTVGEVLGKDVVEKIVSFTGTLAAMFPTEDVKFAEDFSTFVKRFSSEKGVAISDDFFEIGKAGYSVNDMMFGHKQYTLFGTDDEKKKVELLKDLQRDVHLYYHLLSFLKQYIGKYYLTLVLKNESNIYADDISIKLYFDRGTVSNPRKFKLNDYDIGELVAELPQEFVDKDNVDIEDMDYEAVRYPTPIPIPDTFGFGGDGKDLEYYQDYYAAANEEVYPYLMNDKGDKTIIKIDLKTGLKQFTARFLCAKLILNEPVKSVKYKITSKSFGHEISGELTYNGEEK